MGQYEKSRLCMCNEEGGVYTDEQCCMCRADNVCRAEEAVLGSDYCVCMIAQWY